jgi:hypothetical protein
MNSYGINAMLTEKLYRCFNKWQDSNRETVAKKIK